MILAGMAVRGAAVRRVTAVSQPIRLPDRQPTPYDETARVLAVSVLALSLLYTVVSVLAEVPTGLAALDYAAGRDPGTPTLIAGGVLAVGSVLLLLPLWIVTSLWLRAERRRLQGRRQFKNGTAGTFVSWVLPFANLVWPFFVVREVHEAAVEPSRRLSLGSWWALWLLALFAGRISARLFGDQALGEPAGAVLATSAVYCLLLVGAAVLWLRIVRTTSRGHGS